MPVPYWNRFSLLAFLFLILSLTACTPARTLAVARQPEATHPSRALSQHALRQTFVVPDQGAITDNSSDNGVDLHSTLKAQETLPTLWTYLRNAAERWRGVALWIPLLLITPGWLLLWLFHPGGRRPMVPAVAGLSLALIPLLYLWASLIDLRLYEPLVQSLLQAAALLLLLLMIRNPQRLRWTWQTRWGDALALLGLFIIVGIATWLLAARSLPALPPGSTAQVESLAQQLAREGVLRQISAPLPPAVLATTLTRLSGQPLGDSLLLGALLIGVSLIPTLYMLAAEVAGEPWAALLILPLAWLWPIPWQALERGDLVALYSITLLPLVVALGIRALRVTERPWRTVALAAIPLAALALVQGVTVLVAWLLALLFGLGAQSTPDDNQPAVEPLSVAQVLLRALLWLAIAALLWFPASLRGATLVPLLLPLTGGYSLLLVTILIATLAGWLAHRSRVAAATFALSALVAVPLLFWWRSAPLQVEDVIRHELPGTSEVPGSYELLLPGSDTT
ncbi:MAG: hypothetical protein M3220_18195 [Chloroflexota bacterium]|nr:hypothetical protein [Chloroflexota bacterium]